MRMKALLAFATGFVAAGALLAQTKMSGTLSCGKADPQHAIEVQDGVAGHSLTLVKTTCTWSKPFEMAGLQGKDGASASTGDSKGGVSADQGYHTGTVSNGDTYWVRFQGTSTMANGALQSQKGTWSFTGGTGKLKGLQGKGTYKTTASPDGTSSVEVEGEYKLP
ncbi:MAG TPA: hypothetical protein VLH41_09020 [Thermoanaerobaculia bacterium]|nr:hypothetical protein [Thermoanaerobaculia bacterium]